MQSLYLECVAQPSLPWEVRLAVVSTVLLCAPVRERPTSRLRAWRERSSWGEPGGGGRGWVDVGRVGGHGQTGEVVDMTYHIPFTACVTRFLGYAQHASWLPRRCRKVLGTPTTLPVSLRLVARRAVDGGG